MTDESMIEVAHLTKRYAGQTAVDDISFSVRRGEIVGFLGPNGAGKSTTMRILSTYMPATSGTVRVGGYDALRQADHVRSRLGYMPENNPLHLDMRVREYLSFRSRLKGLTAGQFRARIHRICEQCGLTEVQRRIIGQLSKGFRQRVGLADALLHEPDLIILDEPTVGLDPNQIRAVRELIKSLAGKHTVLLSTHILSEVEMTCDRILIIHGGRIIADDTKEELQSFMSNHSVVVAEIAAPRPDLERCFQDIEAIDDFEITPAEDDFFRCSLTTNSGTDLRPLVFAEVKSEDWPLRELTRKQHSLEEIFVHMTGKYQSEGAQ